MRHGKIAAVFALAGLAACSSKDSQGAIQEQAQVPPVTAPVDTLKVHVEMPTAAELDSIAKARAEVEKAEAEYDAHYRAVETAIDEENADSLQTLLNQKKMDLKSDDGEELLKWALVNKKIFAVEVLLRAGADVNAELAEDKTVLDFAIESADAGVLAAVLGAKPDLRHKDQNGNTSLVYAVDCATSGSDKSGMTQQLYVVDCSNAGTVEALLKAGAVADTKNDEGFNALHLAAFNGRADIVSVLVRNKATIDMRNAEGYTPLMLAVQKGHAYTAMVLIRAGASLAPRGQDDKDVFDIAVETENTDMQRMLKAAKAGQGIFQRAATAVQPSPVP